MSDVAPRLDALFYVWHACWDQCPYPPRPHSCNVVRSVPVVKVTAKRIYFKSLLRGDAGQELFVDRAEVERDGSVWYRRFNMRLHLEPPEIAGPPQPKTVAELRRETVEAHPDRGGTSEGFREAHQRYATAKAGGA